MIRLSLGSRRRNAVALLAAILVVAVVYRFIVQGYLVSWIESATYEDKVRRLVDTVGSEVARLRGFPPPSGISVRVVSIEFFKSDTRQSLENDPKLIAQETLCKALLMVPKDFSLLEKKVGLSGIILAAAAGTTIYVVREYFNPDDKGALGTIAHEYTHVLQYVYQPHYDTATTDSGQALSALTEGEAGLVADLYTTNATGRAFSPQIPEPASQKPYGADSGWVLDRLFWFPYEHGEDFVYRIYQGGGWQAVNQVYAKPPSCTAQILHIDRLSDFQPVSLPNPKPVRGDWSISYSDTLGEYSIQLLLLQALRPVVAESATSEWIGDNATIYLSNRTYLLQWQSQWKNEESASDFAVTLSNFFQSMGGVKESELYWDFDGRLITLKQSGQKVILVGSSDKQLLLDETEQFDFSHKDAT